MPEQPDPLADAFQALYDLIERYGDERMQEQHEMWWQIENAMEELAEQGIAKGRRQATEGWKREWGVRGPGGGVEIRRNEDSARRLVVRYAIDEDVRAVSRLVGPWETAEQPEPEETDRG